MAPKNPPKKAADKKKKKKRGQADPNEEPIVDTISITPEEVARLEAYEARAGLQSALIEKLQLRMELLGIRYREEIGVMKGQMRGADNSRDEIMRESNALVGEIETRLGIKMSEYTVADDGTLTHEGDIG